MLRTHVAIAVLFILLFLPHVESKIVFGVAALVASFLPDIDCGFSTLGKNFSVKFLGFLTKHRGFIHSITIGAIISILLAMVIPVAALGFFLGYSLHILADSFTVSGVEPFWPYKKKSKWVLKTGSLTETSLFIVFLLIDVVVIITLIA